MVTLNHVLPDENSLQPFFILHKSPQPSSGKARRRINLSPKSTQKSHDSKKDERDHLELRLQVFQFIWSKIESIIKDGLRNINADVFDKIACWIQESFTAIRSCPVLEATQSTKSYPLLLPANHPASCKQIFSALVFTNNMEFVDDIQTFGDLAQHLSSRGCHVAHLSSLDFSAKNAVGGCLRSLLRQFLMLSTEAADISILAAWYSEQKYEDPIIVIIDGIERCSGAVLSDFIVMLSEWVIKIPIMLVLGVATSTAAISDILPSSVLQYLSPSKFVLESPTERIDAVIAAVLVKHCACFCLGLEVAAFLRNYFLTQDGTLISFVRLLKMAIVQHFILESPNFITGLMEKNGPRDLSNGNVALLQERIIKQTFGLPSEQRNYPVEPSGDISVHGLSDMQRLCNMWSSLVMCLYEAGKCQKVTLLDLYCALLDPQMYKSRASGDQHPLSYNNRTSSNTCCLLGQRFCMQKCSTICQVIRRPP